MDFKELMIRCKQGDEEALEALYYLFKPLLVKKSAPNRVFEEDLFQMQCETLLKCVRGFRLDI